MIVDPKKTPQSSEKNKYDVTVKVSVRDNEGKKVCSQATDRTNRGINLSSWITKGY